jgi:hypothetical protein
MTPENENAYTPEVEDERPRQVHPFTEDEPVTSGPAGTDRVTGEPLRPEDDEPLLPADDEPLRPEAEEVLPLDADEPTLADVDEPIGAETDEPLRSETDEPVRSETYGSMRPETDEPVRSGMGQETAASGAVGGQPVDVAQLGPLFDGSEATEFQQNWGQIQSGFVEDPASAVRRAEDLTDKILGSLTRALEDRRRTLDYSARNGDTEQLRLVLRQYREVLESVTSL